MENKTTAFLSMEHITVRYLDKTLFTNFSWHIEKGQQWAITGPSGSGKSALLQTIAGKFNVINGSVQHHFYDNWRREHTVTDPYFNYRNLLALVGHHHTFRNLSNTTDFYYQQRFNSSDADNAPTVQEYLFGDTPYTDVPEIIRPLRITPLLQKQLIKLSNGETRRVMISNALLQQPQLLMLDNPYIGLDVQARKDFTRIINEIIAQGTTVLLVTTPHEIPEHITHVLTLDNGEITGTYTRNAYTALPSATTTIPDMPTIDTDRITALTGTYAVPDFRYIVEMEDIHVQYGENVILHGINWTIRPNEKWALLGPNGAGKSTLLSLINADNPQAYANKLRLFDRKRGSGESIWDIKRKIGFVSPELHQYFTSRDNCLQVICSGFNETAGKTRATAESTAAAIEWMEIMHIREFADTPFKQAPESIQRLTLLARALIKRPPLLILDEPCQGLDAQQKLHFKQVIDELSKHVLFALIFVTHYEEELPACVNQYLRLQGR